MPSAHESRRRIDTAHDRHACGESAWAPWIKDNARTLLAGMEGWLASLPERPDRAVRTTRRVLALWTAPGLVKRPDIVPVAVQYAAQCPTGLGPGFDFGEEVPVALGRLLRARASAPDDAAQRTLWAASERDDLSWGAQVVFARFAFPHNAQALRERLLRTDFDESAAQGHQSWLLRFVDFPEFNATWGALFESADYGERRALLEAAATPEDQAALLQALAWLVARKPLGPADGIARFAGRVASPAAAVFLTWYLEHGPARGVAHALEGLSCARGPAVQAALARVAEQARDAEQARAARSLAAALPSVPPPEDRFAHKIVGLLGEGGDPGGLSFADRQLWEAAWNEVFGEAEPLTGVDRDRYIQRAKDLVDGRERQRPGLAREWAIEAMTVLSKAPWRAHPEARGVLLQAARQVGDVPLRRAALKGLWALAQDGALVITGKQKGMLATLRDHGLEDADRYRVAALQVVSEPRGWRRLAERHLGEAPPTGLQRHVLAQPADADSRAALVELFEACTEVQRRGLLAAVEHPVAPGYLPVYVAVAEQAAPQTAAAAVEALGRVGDRDTLAALHRLAEARPSLKDAVDAAVRDLRPRMLPVGGAEAGALALSEGEIGGLSEARAGGRGDAAADGEAPLVIKLRPELAFDRMASPPRPVPLSLWFIYLVLGPNRWGWLWNGWLALAALSGLGARPGQHGWALALGVGALGLLGHHWLGGTVAHLRLLRGGRTAQAHEVRHWTRWAGSKGNRYREHVYDFTFVTEGGGRHSVRVESSKPRRELNDDRAEGILYLTRDAKVGARLPIDAMRPVRVDEQGRLRARTLWVLWAAIASSPWPFVLLEALGSRG